MRKQPMDGFKLVSIAVLVAFALTVELHPSQRTPPTTTATHPVPEARVQQVFDTMTADGQECMTDTECEALWDKAAAIAAHTDRQ